MPSGFDKLSWRWSVVLLLLLPSAVVWYVNIETIRFDPVLFINEYHSFLGRLLLIVVGFYLANVFWDQRIKLEKSRRLKGILARHLDRMARKAWESGHLLDQHLSDEHSSLTRDRLIDANIRRFEAIDSTVEHLSREASTSDDQTLMEVFADYRRDIKPIVDRLAGLENLNPGNANLRQGLARLGQSLDALVKRLKGEE